jgi:hypothetical protein
MFSLPAMTLKDTLLFGDSQAMVAHGSAALLLVLLLVLLLLLLAFLLQL